MRNFEYTAVAPREIEELKHRCEKELSKKDGHVMEIGHEYGFSTIHLASIANKFGRKIITFDFHRGVGSQTNEYSLPVFHSNIEKSPDSIAIVPVVVNIDNIKDTMIFNDWYSFVFIDGAHDMKSVIRDFKFAHMQNKGMAMYAFHDYGRFEVRPAIDKIMEEFPSMIFAKGIGTLAYLYG